MHKIQISVAYVAPEGRQYYEELQVTQGTTIFEVLKSIRWLATEEMSGFMAWCVANQHEQPNHRAWYVGIYSQKQRLDTPLKAGDRVEIYRALNDDPMAKRKARSKKQSQAK